MSGGVDAAAADGLQAEQAHDRGSRHQAGERRGGGGGDASAEKGTAGGEVVDDNHGDPDMDLNSVRELRRRSERP